MEIMTGEAALGDFKRASARTDGAQVWRAHGGVRDRVRDRVHGGKVGKAVAARWDRRRCDARGVWRAGEGKEGEEELEIGEELRLIMRVVGNLPKQPRPQAWRARSTLGTNAHTSDLNNPGYDAPLRLDYPQQDFVPRDVTQGGLTQPPLGGQRYRIQLHQFGWGISMQNMGMQSVHTEPQKTSDEPKVTSARARLSASCSRGATNIRAVGARPEEIQQIPPVKPKNPDRTVNFTNVRRSVKEQQNLRDDEHAHGDGAEGANLRGHLLQMASGVVVLQTQSAEVRVAESMLENEEEHKGERRGGREVVMLQAWLQAVKPRSPSRGLTSQAKPNPRLRAGLGLGLGWPKPKPRAQAAAWRGQNNGTTLVLKCVKLTLHKKKDPELGHYEGRGAQNKIWVRNTLCKMRNRNSLSPNVRQKCYLGKLVASRGLSPSQAKPSPPGRLGLGLEESEAKARGFQARAGASKPSQAVTSLTGRGKEVSRARNDFRVPGQGKGERRGAYIQYVNEKDLGVKGNVRDKRNERARSQTPKTREHAHHAPRTKEARSVVSHAGRSDGKVGIEAGCAESVGERGKQTEDRKDRTESGQNWNSRRKGQGEHVYSQRDLERLRRGTTKAGARAVRARAALGEGREWWVLGGDMVLRGESAQKRETERKKRKGKIEEERKRAGGATEACDDALRQASAPARTRLQDKDKVALKSTRAKKENRESTTRRKSRRTLIGKRPLLLLPHAPSAIPIHPQEHANTSSRPENKENPKSRLMANPLGSQHLKNAVSTSAKG
ncbi:hypothetical protein DFH08DRAFT_986499 [Mycena albidolilacea]|uniref:Uncharacterized protein n=1 Tax=Mycena albidolilacea TaxID=1033008 RepID=A0AAD7E8X6_9AGAR|nr:hypothetical protein DFH08DRAFT_986499 [Mycena albidolilacea]